MHPIFWSTEPLRARYIDSNTGKRSDVAHHFLYNLPNFSLDPNEGNNLHVLTNRRVVKVIFKYIKFPLAFQFHLFKWTPFSSRDNRAIGVEYVAREDLNVESRLPPRIAYASRLVVLASGAFGSPAILERWAETHYTNICIIYSLVFSAALEFFALIWFAVSLQFWNRVCTLSSRRGYSSDSWSARCRRELQW